MAHGLYLYGLRHGAIQLAYSRCHLRRSTNDKNEQTNIGRSTGRLAASGYQDLKRCVVYRRSPGRHRSGFALPSPSDRRPRLITAAKRSSRLSQIKVANSTNTPTRPMYVMYKRCKKMSDKDGIIKIIQLIQAEGIY